MCDRCGTPGSGRVHARLLIFGWVLLQGSQTAYAQSPIVTVAPPDNTVSATILVGPKPNPKPKPRPSRTLTIINGTDAVLAALTVSADGLVAGLPKQLDAGQTVALRLPAFRSCTVTISARFEDLEQDETHQQNICSLRIIRLTK